MRNQYKFLQHHSCNELIVSPLLEWLIKPVACLLGLRTFISREKMTADATF